MAATVKNGDKMDLKIYGNTVSGAAGGLFELADRDRHSPSYGCFDYSYWRSKTSGYANGRLQEAAYTLALLYRNDYPGNRCRGLLEAGELARAGLLRWAALQNSDGSFDEWYRGEHGFAATAFSSFALSRAFLLLEDLLAPSKGAALKEVFRRAGGWLCRHHDLDKINHQAVAAAALYSLGELLADPALSSAAGRKVESVLDRQTEEGWFPELGGVDTGYSFLTLEYLAHCYRFAPSDRLEKALLRALDFLSLFVHPEISTGREYNLCGNSYVSLLAAAILAPVSPAARRLFSQGIARNNLLEQLAQDDLSRCYHLYNGLLAYDYARENRECLEKPSPPLPYEGPSFRKIFPRAGLAAVRGEGYYAVVSLFRGGLVKAFASPGSAESGYSCCLDRGYTLRPAAGATATATGTATGTAGATLLRPAAGATIHSFLFSLGNPVWEPEKATLKIQGSFRRGSYFFPGRLARGVLAAVGALPGGYLLLKKGVDFIRRRKKASLQLTSAAGAVSDWRLERRIDFFEGRIQVRDRIRAGKERGGAAVEIELEETSDSRVTGRPLVPLEADLGRALSERGEASIEKELIFTPAGIEVSGRLSARADSSDKSDKSDSSDKSDKSDKSDPSDKSDSSDSSDTPGRIGVQQ